MKEVIPVIKKLWIHTLSRTEYSKLRKDKELVLLYIYIR